MFTLLIIQVEMPKNTSILNAVLTHMLIQTDGILNDVYHVKYCLLLG